MRTVLALAVVALTCTLVEAQEDTAALKAENERLKAQVKVLEARVRMLRAELDRLRAKLRTLTTQTTRPTEKPRKATGDPVAGFLKVFAELEALHKRRAQMTSATFQEGVRHIRSSAKPHMQPHGWTVVVGDVRQDFREEVTVDGTVAGKDWEVCIRVRSEEEKARARRLRKGERYTVTARVTGWRAPARFDKAYLLMETQ